MSKNSVSDVVSPPPPSASKIRKQFTRVEANLLQELYELKASKKATNEFLDDLQSRTHKARDTLMKHNEQLLYQLSHQNLSENQIKRLILSFQEFVGRLANFVDHGIVNLQSLEQTVIISKSDIGHENDIDGAAGDGEFEKYGEFMDEVGDTVGANNFEQKFISQIDEIFMEIEQNENSEEFSLVNRPPNGEGPMPSTVAPYNQNQPTKILQTTQDISPIAIAINDTEAKLSLSETSIMNSINNVRNTITKNLNEFNLQVKTPSIGVGAKKSISDTSISTSFSRNIQKNSRIPTLKNKKALPVAKFSKKIACDHELGLGKIIEEETKNHSESENFDFESDESSDNCGEEQSVIW